METYEAHTPRYGNAESRVINGHTVTIRYPDRARVRALEQRIRTTAFTDPMIATHLDAIAQFLTLPLIIDDFGNDHNARTAWRNELIAKGLRDEYAFFDTSALRGNNLSGPLVRFELLKRIADELHYFKVTNGQDPARFSQVIHRGIKEKQRLEAEYESMTPSQRVAFVEHVASFIESAIRDLITLFEVPTQTQEGGPSR